MEKVIKILMNRDNMTYEEAKVLVEDTMDMMDVAIHSGAVQEAEDIFMDELGLEPDYLIDLYA